MAAARWLRSLRPWFSPDRKPQTPRKTTFKPALEALEDRALPSAVLTHHYDLNGTLADRLGGPSLVSHGGSLGSERYTFAANQGLRLEGALEDTGSFSIEVVAQLDSLDPFFKKLIDFEDLSSDYGLYVSGGAMQLYPGGTGMGGEVVTANTDFHFALTRDGATGETKVYFNGEWQQTYFGFYSDVAISWGNILTFFEDDFATGQYEAGTGSVDRILIYHGALSDDQVLGLLNEPPVVGVDQASVTVDEGQTAANTGSWSDSNGDFVTVSASVGNVTTNTDGTWSWSFTTADGPSDSQTVTITAVDSEGASATTSFQLVVNNVAPVINYVGTSHKDLEQPSANGDVTMWGRFSDAGSLDTHTATVAWGDGVVETVTVDQAAARFEGSHHYAHGGIFTVSVTLSDDDGAVVAGTTMAVVSGVSLVDGTLYVLGTSDRDKVEVDYVAARRSRPAALNVETRLAGGGTQTTSFAADQLQQIVVVAGAGNDYVKIDGDVPVSVLVLAGGGNDAVYGGNHGNVLVGGAGDDWMVGGRGADILIGGDGKDYLFGRDGRDLLIGGWTANSSSLSALDAALAAWQSRDRAAALAALGDLSDDFLRDRLRGGSGKNLLFS